MMMFSSWFCFLMIVDIVVSSSDPLFMKSSIGKREDKLKSLDNGHESGEGVVTCYYASYAIYRTEAGAVFPVDLAALTDVCTHLIYAFAGVDDVTGEIKVLDPYADLGPGDGGYLDGYKKFTDLAKDTYSLNALIAVGGYESAEIISRMAADEGLRGNFVNSVLTFITKYNFDGLDMDWEFPETAEDKVNFVSLLSELDQALHAQGLLLTVAVPTVKWRIDAAYDVPSISSHVDLIHVMAYDYHGAWDKHLHHNAPLYKHHTDADDTLTVNFSINYWIEKGAPVDKLVLGLPLYGRCWTLDDTSKHDILDLGSPSPPGPYSFTNGLLFYSEICKSQMNNNDWVVVEDEEMKVPYGYSLLADNLWCGYDDTTSISIKATLSNTLGLRGMMLWTVDEDDAYNECGLSVSFPLTRKAKEVFNNPLTTPAPTTDPTTATTGCPEGFHQFGEYCFLSNDLAISQATSEAICSDMSSTLPYPTGDFINWKSAVISTGLEGGHWSGAEKQDDGKWFWLDGREVQSDAWEKEPSNVEAYCSYIDPKNGYLYDFECGNSMQILCQSN